MTDENFFMQYAGWSYDPATETPEEGRTRCAKTYAEAERWAHQNGIRFVWDDDYCPDEHDEGTKCQSCIAYDEDGEVVASLGAIHDADDKYSRVIEAHLAVEIMP